MASQRKKPAPLRRDGAAGYLLYRELVALAGLEDNAQDAAGGPERGQHLLIPIANGLVTVAPGLPRARLYFEPV